MIFVLFLCFRVVLHLEFVIGNFMSFFWLLACLQVKILFFQDVLTF
jgi:hypothetical protein